MTVLHYAAYCQNLAGVRHWLDHGLAANQKDDGGWTPLHWAIDMAAAGPVGGAEAIADCLIEHGAFSEFSEADYQRLLEFAHSRDTWVAEHLERFLNR